MKYNSIGKLVYEADVIKSAPSKLSENWIILQVCNDLVNYYNYWLQKNGVVIIHSSWKPHVSVVRGENINKDIFDSYIKQYGPYIEFEYEDICKFNDKGFLWIDCYSKELNNVRKTLGLYLKNNNKFHLTLAKLGKGGKYINMDEILIYVP